jgi:hypothetical protein
MSLWGSQSWLQPPFRRLAAASTMAVALALLAPAAHAGDFDSIESVTRAVYDVISGPAGPRDWARFRAMFADGGRLIAIRTTAGVSTPTVMTPGEYSQRAGANFLKNAFFEAEVAHRVETFGSIAHVFSTYESRRAPGEKPFARGINSFQLIRDATGWKVITILWDSEREGNPIPDKYLSTPK